MHEIKYEFASMEGARAFLGKVREITTVRSVMYTGTPPIRLVLMPGPRNGFSPQEAKMFDKIAKPDGKHVQ